MPRTRTMSNSSAREYVKCSHSALLTSTPDFSSSCLSIGTQLPQVVPARVHDLMPGTSVTPLSAMAERMSPAHTLLHEQTCASSGRSRLAPAPLNSRSDGAAGSSLPTNGRSEVYGDASPTQMPPSSVRASSLMNSFLYTPPTGSM